MKIIKKLKAKNLILVIILLVGLLTILYVMNSQRIYRSKASMQQSYPVQTHKGLEIVGSAGEKVNCSFKNINEDICTTSATSVNINFDINALKSKNNPNLSP